MVFQFARNSSKLNEMRFGFFRWVEVTVDVSIHVKSAAKEVVRRRQDSRLFSK